MPAAQGAEEPEHENNHQHQAENPAEPTMAISVVAVVAAPASQQQDDQNDDQNCFQSFLSTASFFTRPGRRNSATEALRDGCTATRTFLARLEGVALLGSPSPTSPLATSMMNFAGRPGARIGMPPFFHNESTLAPSVRTIMTT
jgi:hypothetical protein